MTLGIMKNGPFALALNDFLLPDRGNRRCQVWNLKEQNSFIFRWVRLSPLPLKANKACAKVELRMVSSLLLRHFKTERLPIKLLGFLQIAKVEFHPDESRLDRLHKIAPGAQYSA